MKKELHVSRHKLGVADLGLYHRRGCSSLPNSTSIFSNPGTLLWIKVLTSKSQTSASRSDGYNVQAAVFAICGYQGEERGG
jgi:hypothetical protein